MANIEGMFSDYDVTDLKVNKSAAVISMTSVALGAYALIGQKPVARIIAGVCATGGSVLAYSMQEAAEKGDLI